MSRSTPVTPDGFTVPAARGSRSPRPHPWPRAHRPTPVRPRHRRRPTAPRSLNRSASRRCSLHQVHRVHQQSRRIGYQRHPRAARDGLHRQQRGHVEQPADGARLHHPALAQQLVDDPVGQDLAAVPLPLHPAVSTATTGLRRTTCARSGKFAGGCPARSGTTAPPRSTRRTPNTAGGRCETRPPAYVDTNVASPNLRAAISSRKVAPSVPDSQKKPIRPRLGTTSARLAFSFTRGSVLMMPRASGPTTRIPHSRALATSSRARAGPSGSNSEKPEEITSSARTPAAAQSSTIARTENRSGRSRWRGRSAPAPAPQIGRPGFRRPRRPPGCTAYNDPVKPPSSRLRTTSCPTVPSRRLTPITTTLRG